MLIVNCTSLTIQNNKLNSQAKSNGFIPIKTISRVVLGVPIDKHLLEVDEAHGLINLPILTLNMFSDTYTDNIRPIDKILNFEYLENGATITDGHGILRACVGGALFGGVGAVVGAVTGQKNSTGICESMKIKVIFDDLENPASYIDILGRQVNGAQKDSAEYEAAFAAAQECMSVLSVLMQRNLDKQGKSVNGTPVRFSVADELLKFKQLLDMGVLTQEEFDKQKKKLLDE